MEDSTLRSMLAEYHEYALKGIEHFIPDKEPKKYLYDLVADYPSRGGKGFRPGLCIAVCKAFGGNLEQVINSATSLEFFHNAFLVLDDIQDESLWRRNKPTMHQSQNVGIAINVGLAMNILSIRPLMMNAGVLGQAISQKILYETERMVTESVEGQAIELGWRKDNVCNLQEEDYLRMVLKKTCWYTCIYPLRVGAIIGSQGKADIEQFNSFGYFMGAAFQIQDDILNLVADENKYGKEIGGDLIEGKRTLMLIHLLKNCSKKERAFVQTFLAETDHRNKKEMVGQVMQLMNKYNSIDYARNIAKFMAGAALKEFFTIFAKLPASKDKTFMEQLIMYMVNRDY